MVSRLRYSVYFGGMVIFEAIKWNCQKVRTVVCQVGLSYRGVPTTARQSDQRNHTARSFSNSKCNNLQMLANHRITFQQIFTRRRTMNLLHSALAADGVSLLRHVCLQYKMRSLANCIIIICSSIQHHNSTSCFVWVWNLVSHAKGRA
jgi:hypothetical protein